MNIHVQLASLLLLTATDASFEAGRDQALSSHLRRETVRSWISGRLEVRTW